MTIRSNLHSGCMAVALLACLSLAGVSHAAGSGTASSLAAPQYPEIRLALAEQRYLEAGQLLDDAMRSSPKNPELRVLAGELGLALGRFDLALKDFAAAEKSPRTVAEALQGEGLVLIRQGRKAEAEALLQRAAQSEPASWRAWNALGTLHDEQKDWTQAEAAYAKALETTSEPALVLNNRGYSRLLQGRLDEASADFVSALQKRPDLSHARTNLRLTLAMRGDYERSMAGAEGADRAALLNNAGFIAAIRGDYGRAETLLHQAIDARGTYYERAAENLKLVRALSAQSPGQQP